MSLQALNWAMVQKCGSPSAKMVLIILSRFASAEGYAWPSRQTLAEATEQSPDSVDRALRLLVERGFIEKGERQVRHDGGDSSVRYRLLFDIRRAEADLQHNHVRPRVRHKERPDQGEPPELTYADPVPQIAAGGGGAGEPLTVPQIAAGGAANLRQGGAADCGTSPERKESKIRISPLAPPAGGDALASNLDSGESQGRGHADGELDLEPGSAIEQGLTPRDRRGSRPGRRGAPPVSLSPDAEARYRQLTATYPADGVRSARLTDAQAAFAELSPAEQAHTIREAAAYAELCRRREQRPKALQTWIRHGFDRAGVPPAGAPAPVSDLAATRNADGMRQAERGSWPTGCSILVLADSAEGAAWEAYFRPFGVKPRWMQFSAGLGAYLPGKTPPARSAA